MINMIIVGVSGGPKGLRKCWVAPRSRWAGIHSLPFPIPELVAERIHRKAQQNWGKARFQRHFFPMYVQSIIYVYMYICVIYIYIIYGNPKQMEESFTTIFGSEFHGRMLKRCSPSCAAWVFRTSLRLGGFCKVTNNTIAGLGKCPILGILNITNFFKYLFEIISPIFGWCSTRTFTNPWIKGGLNMENMVKSHQP